MFAVRRTFCYQPDMLSTPQIDKIVEKAVAKTLTRKRLVRVFSEPTDDPFGGEALSVTIVLKEGAVDTIDGRLAINTLSTILRDLEAAGDDRFPIIWYRTERELAAIDDPEC
jgi:hypothetical protein